MEFLCIVYNNFSTIVNLFILKVNSLLISKAIYALRFVCIIESAEFYKTRIMGTQIMEELHCKTGSEMIKYAMKKDYWV